MHYFNSRRRRFAASTIVALIFLTTIALFYNVVVDHLRDALHDGPDNSGPDNSEAVPETEVRPEGRNLIPPKIWQILLPKKGNTDPVSPKQLQDTASWLALNTDYSYTLVGERGSDDFVHNHYADNTRILDTFANMPNVGMKSDLLRYLLLQQYGGVYTDTDTIALKPIDDWVPVELRDQVRLVVGIEFDRRDGGAWADISHWVQFCQWTIAAAPGHPVFDIMIERVLQSLQDLSEQHGTPIEELHPSSFEVMNSTGPAAWTDAVFKQLQIYEPFLNDTKDLSFMTEPVLHGDILLLNIDGFGMGQVHSHSTHDGTIPDLALMKHRFQGSWRGD
ncbi:hypothetical protein S7711_10185 [Stachybotrys chartarum IBT 7711]|uniref:Initiation-specific alpha-1,6-mannosyltransferase n=1 Tax=Stachybotrys chartarum (strain CBS 109288 / IBT 7711) TaxID=1280523 RepID=A0A084AUX3_STACB|nr:hypothetical protein S7711_10185 [Stachybotrys chartarum IBT 7711]KFA78124.1 hypothetical protein S40288_10324 [Stachybotrys chartarum IBT 40288]